MPPKSKLSTAERAGVESPSLKVIHGIDRVGLFTDHPEPPSNLNYLKKHHCTDIKFHLQQMPYQARWKSRLEIFQPTTECLQLLAATFGNHISININYVEIAADFPAESDEQALSWRDSFLGAARMKSQRQLVVLDEHKNVWYYGPRVNKDGNKRGKVLAVYADKPSKLLNARPADDAPRSLHVESRATGTTDVSEMGIVTLQDLIKFKFKRFWSEQITLFELPKPTELGRLLAKANGTDLDVSGTAFRRRAARWIKSGSINDIFIMHNALLGRPDIVKKLQKISFRDWVNKTIR